MTYISKDTTIPLPSIINWDLIKDVPHQLGPFIIIDFIEGRRLLDILKQPTEDSKEDIMLNTSIDEYNFYKI